MGLFDRFSATRQPAPDVVAVSSQELWQRLMRLNDPRAPWHVRGGAPEGVDLVAEWKSEDPVWRPIFDEINLNETFQIHMRFDHEKSELRAKDKMLEWRQSSDDPLRRVRADVSGDLHVTASVTVNGHHYEFDTDYMKNPIRDTVTSSGWTYRARVFRKL